MKPKMLFPGLFTLTVLAVLLAGATARAADVREYFLLKGQTFVQTGFGAAVASGVSNFVLQCFASFEADGALTNATLI